MADTFSYTNSSAATKTLNIGRLVTSGKNTTAPNEVRNQTLGGKTLVGNVGDETKSYTYTFIVPISSVGSTDEADVLEFFGSTYTNYGVNAFTWTDNLSVARTVRLNGTLGGPEYVTPTDRRFTIKLDEDN